MSSAWPNPGAPGWAAEAVHAAERVPAWTRPGPIRFTAAAAGGMPGGFSAWVGAEAEAEDGPASIMAGPDPDAIEAEAFARGFDAGHAAAVGALATEHAGIERLARALEGLRPEPPTDLAGLLAETVSRLVRQVMGEVAIDAGLMAERTAAIAQLITEDSGPSRLRVNPVDIERLGELAPPNIALLPDAAIAEGTIRAETAQGWVEDGPAIRLERLRGLLDQMARSR